ncbi:MAG: ribosome biogenesis GTP-binding protein YihA/YsxC [Pseudomonadota bacterium]
MTSKHGSQSDRDANATPPGSEKELRVGITFLGSAASADALPPADQPEVAIAGRSNAGKSSVLNRFAGQRQLARVSKTPGRTQLLNFFAVGARGRLVDLPGYGYAKAGKAAQAQWQGHVNRYLSERDTLVGLLLVMDVRHPFSALDEELLEWAHQSQLPAQILLNKADKLKSGARSKALLAARKRIARQPLCGVQLFSAQSGLGQGEALSALARFLDAPSAPQTEN